MVILCGACDRIRKEEGLTGVLMKEAKIGKIAVIGPVYPFKGGISHYTGLLVRELRKQYETEMYSYRMQYPKLLFRREQRDYANKAFEISGTKYLIHTADPFHFRSAAEQILKGKPDLILIQWWHPYFAPCDQALLKCFAKCAKAHGGKPKLAFICHNVLPHERFPMDALLTKHTLKYADFCIVHSLQDAEDLKKMLPAMRYDRQVHPTYNAFRLRGIGHKEAREELGIPEEEEMLLFFGYVRDYKGLDILIRSMRKRANRKLYVVGDFGDKKQQYLDLIEREGIKEYVVIRDGYVPDTEVEPYFAAADLCVCPYRSATQSGIVQIAYGFNLPVIATKVGGLPEVVSDGKTGYLVAPENTEELSDAIDRFFTERKAAEFRENVEKEAERFSWTRMAETIARLYGEAEV